MTLPSRRSRFRRIAVPTAAVLIVLVVAAWLNMDGMLPVSRATATSVNDPRPIAGGQFEASGVVQVPGTNQVLFVDDGRTREVFLMELAPDGSQRGAAHPVALGADVTDLEGITTDGRHYYAVGSQSKKAGFDGDGLVRFTFDPATRRVAGMERIQGLKAWLATNVAELRGTEARVGDDVLNIEGLAWDPRGHRLLLGLRAPIVGGAALIIPIKLIDSTAGFTRENISVDVAAIRVPLNGAGIRSLEYDAHAGAFRIITGAGANEESLEFRIVEWDGLTDSPVREVVSFDRRLKPEGITGMVLDGRQRSVIVFDVGSFLIVE
jgi:hypothetical protein